MSALGQKQTFRSAIVMSALPERERGVANRRRTIVGTGRRRLARHL